MIKKTIVLPSPNAGLNSVVSPTLINDNELALAENVEFISGKVRKRPGTSGAVSIIDSVTGTTNDVIEPRYFYNFIKSDGVEVPIIYERGIAGATKEIYYASISGGDWTWSALQYNSNPFVLNSARTPAFITVRGKLFLSNGDTTDGLVYWSGSGEIAYVRTGGTTSVCGKFFAYFKERLVVANGQYRTGSAWNGTDLTSAIFYSSITNSSGAPVNPDSHTAWHEVASTYNEIEPNDGSEITALWVWLGRIYVAKETGIWVMYGVPKNFTIEKVSDIGMETDRTLQKYDKTCTFLNDDGFYVFDGRSEPQKIDKNISNLIVNIPPFAVGGTGSSDLLQFSVDSGTEWTNAKHASSTNITIPNGNIEISKVADGVVLDYHDAWDFSYNVATHHSGIYRGFAFYFTMEDASSPIPEQVILTSIRPRLSRGSGTQSGTIKFDIRKATEYGVPGDIISSTVSVSINDLSETEALYTVDFSSDNLGLDSEDSGYFFCCYWDESVTTITNLTIYTDMQVVTRPLAFLNKYSGNWGVIQWYARGMMYVRGQYYNTQAVYQTVDTYCDLTATPSVWGKFHSQNEVEGQKIEYRMLSSSDQSNWYPSGGFSDDKSIIEPDTIINSGNIPANRYLDFQITMDRVDGNTTPQVKKIEVNAFVCTSDESDRMVYSTIFNDKYKCSTNYNLDNEYRTFVLDKEGRWSIEPDQIIYGYIDYNNEKYLLTKDAHGQIHKMHKGITDSDFLYDHSTKSVSGDNKYLQKVRTKKYDCGFPDYIKLFREMRFSVGSIFGENYVQGTLKYRLDDGDWTTVYFQDERQAGDSVVIRHIFPAGERGYYIQFEYQTYLEGSNYGGAYNIIDNVVEFFVQKLKPIKSTQTSALSDTGHMVEE